MFCRYCGKRIDENLKYCPFCGAAQASEPAAAADPFDTPPPTKPAANKTEDGNTLAIAGFILAFFVPIAGIICSWMGYKRSRDEGLPYGGLAKAGLIVSIVSVALSVLAVVIYVVVIVSVISAADSYYIVSACSLLGAL